MKKGFNDEGFMAYVEYQFPGVFSRSGGSFTRELLENLIEYAHKHEQVGKDQFCDFLSSRMMEDYPEFSRNTGAGILEMVQNHSEGMKLQDSINFAADGLFCEWAWVIDLDAGTFEGYCGFGQTPLAENDRFYFLRDLEEDNGYHGVRLAAKWNLDALPTDEEFLAAFKNDEEEETPTF